MCSTAPVKYVLERAEATRRHPKLHHAGQPYRNFDRYPSFWRAGIASLQARATGMSAQHVVYPGVLRSCFIDQARRSPAKPALAINTVPPP